MCAKALKEYNEGGFMTKVITYGTFDLFHEGHYRLLKRAKELVEELEERDKEIIIRRYFNNQTQSQVAKELQISQVQVSRLEKKILKSMREKIV